MKYVDKQPEPQALVKWKATVGDPQRRYAHLPREVKTAVKQALMREQGYICCYCEQALTDRDSHIEHLVPQSCSLESDLDYGNLLCSCQSQPIKDKPLHCGHAKGSWYDPDLLVSPLDPGCETRFGYEADGSILPDDPNHQGAKETIRKLSLDAANLRAMRAQAIAPFLDEQISPEDVHRFVASYLQLDANGKFKPFHTTIRYLFSDSA